MSRSVVYKVMIQLLSRVLVSCAGRGTNFDVKVIDLHLCIVVHLDVKVSDLHLCSVIHLDVKVSDLL